MEHPNKYLEDDKHLCIRCKNTIIGLDNYVLHRKNECQEPFSSSPTDLAHLTRDSEVGERYGITEKPQVETDRVSETFSDDVIDLSTNTKRNFHSAGHSATILFPSSSSLDSNSAEQKESSKLCKTYNTESYSEPYGDIDTYQNHFISNRDQPIFIDYRNSGTEQSRKEMFATPNNYSSSSDIFHQEHQEPSGISLFRSFESFNESFKNNQDIVHGNYLSQTANKYIGEVSNFDNKSPEIYSVSENESFLGSDNHSKSNPYKSKLLSNPIDEAERQNFQKQNYYEEEISKNKLDDTNIPECGTKNSCSNDAVDFSKQEDIRQNDFLSSLELTSNVTKKIMKYELDIEDDEDYDDSRPPSHYTGGKWPPGTDPHLRESGKWIFSPRSVEEDCQDDFDELNENAIEQQSFQPPPPSYTKGKWLPGKRMIDSNKYNLDEDYDCKSCSRTLKGKAAYESHIHSESHFVKDKKICQENNSESLNKRPIRATKQQAQIFLKQKISLIKNKRNKMKVSKILESNIPEAEMKVEFEEKIAPSKYEEMSDESDPEEKLNKNKYTKILCPICRLSFSIVYSSQHFASLAHIHNELEFNQKPNNEIRKKYDKIILKNIEPFIKTSYFLCKPCKFYTNSHDDFEAHFNLHEDECQSSQTRIIFSCSACPDETDLYSLRDLQRHLQVSQHRKNVRYEIFQVRQIVLTYNIEILCILCNQAFRYNKAYQNHRRIFHEEKSFQLVNQRLSQCPECSYQGTTERIVRIHLKKEHKINCSSSYFCFVCGLKFDTSSKADSHRHSVDHRIIIDKYKGKPNERTCSICYLNVANISLLRQHMNDEHRKELTPCFYCGLVFPLRADLTAHRKNCPQVISLLDGIYKCDLCSFSNDLLAHVLMHTLLVHFEKEEAKLYSCHICKTRIQGRSMKNHMLLHTKELKYSCVHCSRRFSEEEWLEKHLTAVHSSLVKRKRCGRAEEDKTLSSDRKGIGGKNVQKESKRFLCEICGKTYGSKYVSHETSSNEQHVEGIVAMETESLPVNTKICDNKQAPSSKSLIHDIISSTFNHQLIVLEKQPKEIKTVRIDSDSCSWCERCEVVSQILLICFDSDSCSWCERCEVVSQILLICFDSDSCSWCERCEVVSQILLICFDSDSRSWCERCEVVSQILLICFDSDSFSWSERCEVVSKILLICFDSDSCSWCERCEVVSQILLICFDSDSRSWCERCEVVSQILLICFDSDSRSWCERCEVVSQILLICFDSDSFSWSDRC
ncbi:PR domain zinc finger protein 14 [Armadillidium vulgare]|nr:PR domain zinc finger protein 14 [Armadillidium vulgare]